MEGDLCNEAATREGIPTQQGSSPRLCASRLIDAAPTLLGSYAPLRVASGKQLLGPASQLLDVCAIVLNGALPAEVPFQHHLLILFIL